tara:strand:+ start:2038 stop:2166 length:129 start_codon:yes stop_codon:yes gene_type:complete
METFILTLFIFMAFIASGISFGLFFKPLKGSCGGINCKCMRK